MTSSLALMEQASFSVRSGCRSQMEVWMMGQSLGPSPADLNTASTNPLEQSTAEPFQSKGNALVGKSWHTRRLAAHQDPDRGPFSACKKWFQSRRLAAHQDLDRGPFSACKKWLYNRAGLQTTLPFLPCLAPDNGAKSQTLYRVQPGSKGHVKLTIICGFICGFIVDWKPILTYATFGCKTSAGCF